MRGIQKRRPGMAGFGPAAAITKLWRRGCSGGSAFPRAEAGVRRPWSRCSVGVSGRRLRRSGFRGRGSRAGGRRDGCTGRAGLMVARARGPVSASGRNPKVYGDRIVTQSYGRAGRPGPGRGSTGPAGFREQPTQGPFVKLFAKRPSRNKKKSLLRILRSDFLLLRLSRPFMAANS